VTAATVQRRFRLHWVFIGLSPFWGFQTLLVISLSVLFKLNKVLAFVASNVSLPPFIPFIIAASLFLGAPFVQGDSNILSQDLNFELIKNNLLQYIIGSFIPKHYTVFSGIRYFSVSE
jgi:uncharacterized protein (DUF2062 family)